MPNPEQRRFNERERNEALERAGHCCQWCRSPHTDKNPLTFHHAHIWQASAKYYQIPGQLVAASENAVVLCRECHDKVHRGHKHQTQKEIYKGIERVALKTNQEEIGYDTLRRLRGAV